MTKRKFSLLNLSKCLTAWLLIAAGLLSGQVRADSHMDILPVTEIAEGIFVFQGAYEIFNPDNEGLISNMGFIVGEAAVAVIDTGGSRRAGERLKATIRKHTQLPIIYVINTHMHPDHVFGNAAFAGAATHAADRLSASGIDKKPRGRQKASDHTPVWCEIDDI